MRKSNVHAPAGASRRRSQQTLKRRHMDRPTRATHATHRSGCPIADCEGGLRGPEPVSSSTWARRAKASRVSEGVGTAWVAAAIDGVYVYTYVGLSTYLVTCTSVGPHIYTGLYSYLYEMAPCARTWQQTWAKVNRCLCRTWSRRSRTQAESHHGSLHGDYRTA